MYGPPSLDSEGVYEAKLAVPGKDAQSLFGVSHPYRRMMEDKCGVTAVTGSGGPSDTDPMIVTLRGAHLPVEYCRAEMREMVLNTELARVQNRRTMYRWVPVVGFCLLLLLLPSQANPCIRSPEVVRAARP